MATRIVPGINAVQAVSWDGKAASFIMAGRYENDGEGTRRVHDAEGAYYDLPCSAIVRVRPVEVDVPDEKPAQPPEPEMSPEEVALARKTMEMQQEAIRKARREAQEALQAEKDAAEAPEVPAQSAPGPNTAKPVRRRRK